MFSRLFREISLLAALCVYCHAAEDKLFNMNTDMEKLIAPYMEKAKSTFPAVKKKYIAGDYVREKRQLDVQINLVDKDGTKEMVFVYVTQCLGNRFQGIARRAMRSRSRQIGEIPEQHRRDCIAGNHCGTSQVTEGFI